MKNSARIVLLVSQFMEIISPLYNAALPTSLIPLWIILRKH